MTKKKSAAARGAGKKLKLKKETLKDLASPKKSQDVKGGAKATVGNDWGCGAGTKRTCGNDWNCGGTVGNCW